MEGDKHRRYHNVEKGVEVPVHSAEDSTEEDTALSVKEAINEEIAASRSENYPLVIAAFPEGSEDKVLDVFDVPALTLEGRVYAILPYTRAKDVQALVKDMEGKLVVVTARHNADSIIKELSK